MVHPEADWVNRLSTFIEKKKLLIFVHSFVRSALSIFSCPNPYVVLSRLSSLSPCSERDLRSRFRSRLNPAQVPFLNRFFD